MADPTDISYLPPPPPGSSGSPDSGDTQASSGPDISGLPPPPGVSPASQAVAPDISQLPPPPNDSSPSQAPPMLRRTDIEAIARRHGVDPDQLQDLAPYYGAKLAPEDEQGNPSIGKAAEYGVKGAIGFADVTHLARFAAKKSVSPEMRNALDEMSDIGEQQKSLPEKAAEFAVPLPSFGAAASRAGRVAEAAGIGAGMGLGSSHEGHELGGAAVGAAAGTGLGIFGEALSAGLGKLGSKLSEGERDAVQGIPAQDRQQIDVGAQKLLDARQESEQLLKEQVLDPSAPDLSPEQQTTILREQVQPDALQDLLDPTTETGALLQERAQESFPDLPPEAAAREQLVQETVEKRAQDLAEQLGHPRPDSLEDAQAAIQETASRQGDDYVAQMSDLMSHERASLEYIDEAGLSRVGRKDTFLEKYLINPLADAQFPIRTLDERLGTSGGLAHSDLVGNNNRMVTAREGQLSDLRKIAKQFPGADVALRNGTIVDAIEGGDLSHLPPAQQDAAKAVSSTFEKWRNFANTLGGNGEKTLSPLSIPERENYVPHLTLPPQKLIPAIQEKMNGALQQATESLGREVGALREIKPQEYKQLVQEPGPLQDLDNAVTFADSRTVRNGADLDNMIQDKFLSRDGGAAVTTMAKAAEEREGEIPDWMREKNAYLLMNRWSQNTLRHLYLRQPLARLASVARVADAAGDKLGAGYLNRLMQDVNGIRPMTGAAAARNISFAWQRKMGRVLATSDNPVVQRAAIIGQVLPEVLHDLSMQIYPNLIGLNAKSHIQHLVQPFYKLWPELGFGRYGTTTLLRGISNAVLNFRTLADRSVSQGLLPTEMLPKYDRFLAEGPRANRVYAGGMNAAQVVGQASMHLYGKLFQMNKMIGQSVADVMASDIARGSKLVDSALLKFPGSVQRAVRQNPEAASQILGQYFGDSVVYNYSRAAKSEFGRTMGQMMSTFTKWPLATAGDILSEYRSKNAYRASAAVLRKYFAPLAAMQGMQYLLLSDPAEMDDRQKKLFGSGGLGGMAPLRSLTELKNREFGTPPVVDTLFRNTVIPAINGDPEALGKGLANAVQQFTPGSVYVRFLTDDLPTLVTGRRPEGDDFLERTQSGAQQLNKGL